MLISNILYLYNPHFPQLALLFFLSIPLTIKSIAELIDKTALWLKFSSKFHLHLSICGKRYINTHVCSGWTARVCSSDTRPLCLYFHLWKRDRLKQVSHSHLSRHFNTYNLQLYNLVAWFQLSTVIRLKLIEVTSVYYKLIIHL